MLVKNIVGLIIFLVFNSGLIYFIMCYLVGIFMKKYFVFVVMLLGMGKVIVCIIFLVGN